MSPALASKQRKAAPGTVSAETLRIDEPKDAFEHEAEAGAHEVRAGERVQPEWSLSKMSIAAPLQRKCACGGSTGLDEECEECKQAKTLRRKAAGTAQSAEAPPIVHEVLRSPGQRLDPATRSFMESRLRRDFGNVRVHTGREAATSARRIGAQAYSIANHLVFGTGAYAPGTSIGRELLSHELAHVAQAAHGEVALRISTDENAWETEADSAASSLSQGHSHQVTNGAPALIRRRVDPQLREYLKNMRLIARDKTLENTRTELIVARLIQTLHGLDLKDQDNLTFVLEVIAQEFPNRVSIEFLIQTGSLTPPQTKPSREREQFERTERLLAPERRGPYGIFGPGLVLPVLLGGAAPQIHLSDEAKNALGSAAFLVGGVYGGLSESIGDEELNRLSNQLNKAGALTVIFPPIFVAGGLVGVGEDVVNIFKGIYHLVRGDLGEWLAGAVEFMQVLISPQGKAVAFKVGLEIGRQYAQELIEASNESIPKFTFELGRVVGPIIIYTILAALGVPEAIAARIAQRLVPILLELLEDEPRLARIVAGLGKRLGYRPPAPPAPISGAKQLASGTQRAAVSTGAEGGKAGEELVSREAVVEKGGTTAPPTATVGTPAAPTNRPAVVVSASRKGIQKYEVPSPVVERAPIGKRAPEAAHLSEPTVSAPKELPERPKPEARAGEPLMRAEESYTGEDLSRLGERERPPGVTKSQSQLWDDVKRYSVTGDKADLVDLTRFENPPGERRLIDPDFEPFGDNGPNYRPPRIREDRLRSLRAKYGKQGPTNRQLASEGNACYLRSGDRVELHHRDQNPFGPLDEHSESFHRFVGEDPEFHPEQSDPGYATWRGDFALFEGKIRSLGDIYNILRERYWKTRFQ